MGKPPNPPPRARLLLAAAISSALMAASAVAVAQPAPPAPVITQPRVLTHVDAEYPPSAAGKHADVVLDLVIDSDGHVTEVVVHTSGGKDLDDAATAAVRQWTFVPATLNGEPVPAKVRVPFHFAPASEPPASEGTTTIPGGVAAPASQSPAESSMTTPPASPAKPPPAAVKPAPAAPPEVTTDEVNVHGGFTPRPVNVSDYTFTLGEQVAVPRAHPADVLKLTPGFLLTNEGGEGHAEQVFLRGFDAHEGQDLEFTVDGVPFNDAGNLHGNGYADSHFIIPELIHSVRVLEGPYAPQQGNFAVAGSADFHLGLDRRGLTAEYTVGDFNTQRLLVLYGPADAPTGTFAGAEYYTTDGFGTNRQAKRGTAMGQMELPVGDRGLLRLTTQVYVTEFNTAGIVREDDYDTGRVGFYGTEDPNQTGDTASRASIAATYEWRGRDMELMQQLYVIDRTMRLREDDTGFIEDVQLPTQEPHDQRGDLIDLHFAEDTVGGKGAARWHGQAFGLRQEFEAGYVGRIDEMSSTQDRLLASNLAPYKREVDLDATLGDVGVYVDGNVHLLPWLGLRGGVRADMFTFDVLNNCAVNSVDNPSKVNPEVDVSCLSELDHGAYREPSQRSTTASGAIMPRGTVVFGPIQHFDFALSLGNGVRSIDPIYVAQGAQTPFVSAQSRDAGVSYNRALSTSTALSARSVFFQTHVDQDLVFDPSVGRNTLAGGSTRTGWAGSARVIGSFYDVSANATVVKAVFDDTGLLVPYVPDVVVRADVVLFKDLPWQIDHLPVRATLGYGMSYVGRRPLTYGQLSDIMFVSDASAGLGWSIWHARLSALNLFDSQYKLGEYNYVSDFHTAPEPTLVPERMFTAGAPRQVMLTLSATLGGS